MIGPAHTGIHLPGVRFGNGDRYWAMVEPSEFQKSLIEQVTYLRGRIITSYAQVEFLLADISVKLDLRFPYRISDRIKAAKRIGERPGYQAYKEDIDRVCDELLIYAEMRNFLAHGFLMLTTDKTNNHEFQFRMYQRTEQGEFNLVLINTNTARLKLAAQNTDDYVQRAHALFRRIYLEKGLEQAGQEAQ
jgi:hypothetical protein